MAVPAAPGLMTEFVFSVAMVSWLAHGFLNVNAEIVSVSVSEGDSVTLLTDIKKNPDDRIRWYCLNACIAQITRDQSKTCEDDECKERFSDRLQLDDQTGSLTIINTRSTDSGLYDLKINANSNIETFNVSVHGVAAEVKRKSVKNGESVTLDTPGVIKQPNHSITWCFNDSLIAEITGDQSKICEDVRCDERFRDRLKLDQTGSLIITNTRSTDSGLYKVEIKSNTIHYSTTNTNSFTLSVTGGSGLSSAAVAGIVGVVLLLLTVVAAAAVIHYRCRSSIKDEGSPQDRRGSCALTVCLLF